MRFVHVVNLLLLAALFLGSAAAWSNLPGTIPVHFGLNGQPDSFANKTILSWFGLPLVALATTAFTYLVAHLLPRWPNLINLPQKAEFLALPLDRQLPVIDRMREMLYGVSTMVILLFGFIQVTIFRTARGHSSEGAMVLVLLFCVLMTPLILVTWLPKIQRELDKQKKMTPPPQ